MATSLSDPNEREINFLKAQLADQAGRHDHAVRFMINLAKSATRSSELSPPERALLRNSLQKFLDDHHSAWREIGFRTVGSTGERSDAVKFYLERILKEILNVCREIKQLINCYLMPSARSAESRVFYLTFQGDVSAYIVVLNVNDDGEDAELAASVSYRAAKAIAKKELTWLNPVRLTLALKMSEFYANVAELIEKGASIAKKALNNAMNAGFTNLAEGELKNEINDLLEKLRENIALWIDSEEEEEAEAGSQLVAGTSQVASPFEIGEKATASRSQPFRQSKAAAVSVIRAAAAAAAETSDSRKATKRVRLRSQKQ